MALARHDRRTSHRTYQQVWRAIHSRLVSSNVRQTQSTQLFGSSSSRHDEVRAQYARGFELQSRELGAPQSQGHEARRSARPQRRRAFTAEQASGSAAWAIVALSVSAQPLPNPSLEPTRSGMAPWPRGFPAYHPPRGQGAMPPRSAQLKR